MDDRDKRDNRYWTQRSRENYDRDSDRDFWNRREAEAERITEDQWKRYFETGNPNDHPDSFD